MGDSNPQPPSTRYTTLHILARTFLTAQNPTPHLPTPMDFALLHSLVSPSYIHTFGPSFFVAQTPKLQGDFSIEAWIRHLQGMIPALEGWSVDVRSVVVDEVRAVCVVGVGYGMRVKGAGEEVVNEVTWWLEMEQGGGEGEWRVRRSREVVDPVAAGRVRELIMAGDAEKKATADAG